MISLPLFNYVLSAAMRDKLFIAMLAAFLVVTNLSIFLSSAAVTEQDQFAAVYMAGALRIVGVAGLSLFVVFFMRRSFESKDVEFLLSRPVGRIQFLLSYALAFAFLAALTALMQGVCLAVIGRDVLTYGYALWFFSMLAENIIMVTMALFVSMVIASQTAGAMVIFGFYVLTRMMGQILGIIDADKTLWDVPVMEYLMQAISAVMPRLDLMGQTSWLVYGLPGDSAIGFGFVAAQLAVFVFLVLMAAIIDLKRREF